MWPILVLGSIAAAIFLPGCKEKQEETLKPAPPPPFPSADPLPETSPDGYALTFRDNPLEVQIFRGLWAKGIRGVDLDQGCIQRKFDPSAGLRFEKISEKDRGIHSCELYGLSLSRYKEFPELAALITRNPIPWSLDDFDPKTLEDQKIRETFQKSIGLVDELLKAKGYAPESLDYKRRMAMALTFRVSVTQEFLAMLQDSPSSKVPPELRKIFREELKRVREELKTAGIPEFWEHLKSNAFPRWKSDDSVELSALEALRAETGDCTEQSKVLYAALEMAGIVASFVEVDPWRSEHWLLKGLRGQDPNYRHVAVQAEFGKETMVLDPSLWAVNPAHGFFFPLTLRQFAALELSNRAMGPVGKGGKGDLNLLDRALALDDHLDLPLMNRGKLLLEQEGKPEKALEDLERAVTLNPNNAFAYGSRARIFFHQKQSEKALQDLNRAIELNGEVHEFYNNRAAVWLSKGEPQRAAEDMKKALQLNPEKALPQVLENAILFEKNSSKRLPDPKRRELEEVRKDLGKDPAVLTAQVIVAVWLTESDQIPLAKRLVEDLAKQLGSVRDERSGRPFLPSTQAFLKELHQVLQLNTRKNPSIAAGWNLSAK